MKKLLFSAAIMGLFFTASCSKDDDGGGLSCEQRATSISEAAQAYANNPNVENCKKYRSALKSYLDANCPGSSGYDGALEGLTCE